MWLYNDKPVEEIEAGFAGFVYLITNLSTGKKYVGKKLFHNKKTKQIKGKRKKYVTESDWKTYYGSNAELLAHVAELGAHNFKREILFFCLSRTECSYMEAKLQFQYDVLRYPNKYYNSWVSVKINRRQLSTRFAPKE